MFHVAIACHRGHGYSEEKIPWGGDGTPALEPRSVTLIQIALTIEINSHGINKRNWALDCCTIANLLHAMGLMKKKKALMILSSDDPDKKYSKNFGVTWMDEDWIEEHCTVPYAVNCKHRIMSGHYFASRCVLIFSIVWIQVSRCTANEIRWHHNQGAKTYIADVRI